MPTVLCWGVTLASLTVLMAAAPAAHSAEPTIPKVWDDQAIDTLEVPAPEPEHSPMHVRSEYYYRIPVRPIYRTYPRYRPGKEPVGYVEWLRTREPEIVFDASKLKGEQDWIRAGELVFNYPVDVSPDLGGGITEVVNRSGDLFGKDDVSPFVRYVVRKKGVVEFGAGSCADCHSRVMPDGLIVAGAQGNRPVDRIIGTTIRVRYEKAANDAERHALLESNREVWLQEFSTPWSREGPQSKLLQMSIEEMASLHEAIPPGVIARQRASVLYPPAVPSLIGVKDIRYLDRTGLMQHRDIGDLMRYAALNQGADMLASYGGFVPLGTEYRNPPDPATQERYSDEQLYALALFIYSLKPPPSPNRFDERAARGEQVFKQQGCPACHPPPLYTNNKLTPASGFKIPAEHKSRFEILPISVGTDPSLTLVTPRGTGYYKVPSLRGVWYRGPFEHNGSVATLDDWFDANRLKHTYVPSGFKGASTKARPVPGHEFGLRLKPEDKRSLIAFLNTL